MGTLIDGLFPAGVLSAQSSGPAEPARLFPEEAACVARAGAKRRNEFASGRLLAREVLADSGFPDFPLIVGADRAPVWPDGLIGSISHCEGICGVAVARRGSILALGLDLEPVDPLPGEIVGRVCTAAESSWAESRGSKGDADWHKLFFSAKESVYKALHGLTQQEFDFLDVEVGFQPQSRQFTVSFLKPSLATAASGLRIEGRFCRTGDHLGTGISVFGRA